MVVLALAAPPATSNRAVPLLRLLGFGTRAEHAAELAAVHEELAASRRP